MSPADEEFLLREFRSRPRHGRRSAAPVTLHATGTPVPAPRHLQRRQRPDHGVARHAFAEQREGGAMQQHQPRRPRAAVDIGLRTGARARARTRGRRSIVCPRRSDRSRPASQHDVHQGLRPSQCQTCRFDFDWRGRHADAPARPATEADALQDFSRCHVGFVTVMEASLGLRRDDRDRRTVAIVRRRHAEDVPRPPARPPR
ncbi:MAG: hypothetical protein MZW92_18785 [Comamonadaceae bacterium]|nr:hypothetical protein [Comamonadaceae bacterium]